MSAPKEGYVTVMAVVGRFQMNLTAYWKAALQQNADEMRKFFHKDAFINWHNTNEHFTVEEFIRANCEYPGSWNGEIERIEQCHDLYITVTHVFATDKTSSFHVTSFIRCEAGFITSIDEYWGDDGSAPQWRMEQNIGTSIHPAWQNPWTKIDLSDYENHMKWESVMQLQAMNEMMKEQFRAYPVHTIMILGIAGGNGLEHTPSNINKIYGVDINPAYLAQCAKRYTHLESVLECVCTDLTSENITLPYADMVVANLLIEYIGYRCFQTEIAKVDPLYVSCIIQSNTDDNFVSDSPYLHVFDNLHAIHHPMQETELIIAMKESGYALITKKEQPLPNGKKLVQLDFKK